MIATANDPETHGMVFAVLQTLANARPEDLMEYDEQIMNGMKVHVAAEMSSAGATVLAQLAKLDIVS